MAIPFQPTSTTISTEGLKLFGKNNPSTAEITRATDYGIEMTKELIMDEGAEWDFLRTTSYQPTTAYVSKYQLPTDYNKMLLVRCGDPESTGTAQAVSSTTITFASSYTGNPLGKDVVVTSATLGANQKRQVKSYDTGTKIGTLDEAWDTAPTGTVVYAIISTWSPLTLHPVYTLDELYSPSTSGKPTDAFHLADSAEGDLYLNTSPDTTYVLEINYYANLNKVDLTSTLYDRFLRLMNGTLIQGVFVWALQDDQRHDKERKELEKQLAKKAARFLYPNNLSEYHVRLDI